MALKSTKRRLDQLILSMTDQKASLEVMMLQNNYYFLRALIVSHSIKIGFAYILIL